MSGPQAAFVNAVDQFPAFVGGFGSGKTAAGVMRTLALKFKYPRLDVAYYLPTYDLVRMIGYALIQYAKLQMRISTATDGFLDLISYDFFGNALPRRTGEQDDPFRARIKATLLREKGTRTGMYKMLVALTGRAPIIVEPARPLDIDAMKPVGTTVWVQIQS